MSKPSSAALTLSTLHLSADGARVVPDGGKTNVAVTEAEALAALTAFANVPAVALVDVDAKIYLAGPRGKVAVQNVGGKLFVAQVPESVNAAAERTPQQTIALLTTGDSGGASAMADEEAAKEAEIIAEAARNSRGWRGLLDSGWLLVGLLAVTVIMGYVSFAPETPEGIAMVRDPVKISGFNTQFNGRYGAPDTTVLVLDQGRLKGVQVAEPGGPEEQVFEMGYGFGLRENQVVIVVDNGALLEPQPDRSLKFLASTYPRLAR